MLQQTLRRARWASIAACLATETLCAQPSCGPQWLADNGAPGVVGTLRAVTFWDPDGAGSLQPWTIVGGSISAAGSTSVSNIAGWDPNNQVWRSLGSGVTGGLGAQVTALTTLPGGDLIAAGTFTTAGGATVNNIARWNGTSWSALGTGVNGLVWSLAVTAAGEVIAGGEFTTASGTAASRIARWSGSAWSALGAGMNDAVTGVLVHPSGDIYATGGFTVAGGVAANFVARWNGTTWSGLGSGLGAAGYALHHWNGEVVAGGEFTSAGGVTALKVAKWNGTVWSALGTGLNASARAFVTDSSGGLVVGGGFTTAGGQAAGRVATWSGTSWTAMGSGMDAVVFGLAQRGGSVTAVGSFTTADGKSRRGVATKFGTSDWDDLADNSVHMWIKAVALAPDGSVVAGGEKMDGSGFGRVQRWNGLTWTTVGGDFNDAVDAIVVLADGEVVAGGGFTSIGGVAASRVARWNGSAWAAMGAGLSTAVRSLYRHSNGQVLAGGLNRLSAWNGSGWTTVSSAIAGEILAVSQHPNGDIVVGGAMQIATSSGTASAIARWNGTSWNPYLDVIEGLGLTRSGGTPIVRAISWLGNGNMIVAGTFSAAGGLSALNIASWDGQLWSNLGGGVGSDAYSLHVRPDGELVVGGFFGEASGVSGTACIAGWNGTAWRAFATGLNGFVNAIQTLPASGEMVCGGGFSVPGPVTPASNFARWTEAAPPWIALQPAPAGVLPGASAVFSGSAAAGFFAQTHQWQMETGVGSGTFAPLPAGPIAGGGGAIASISTPMPVYQNMATPSTLTITNVTAALHNRRVRLVVTTACGSATSQAALLSVTPPPCYPNCDASTGTPLLTSNDFQCFLNRFAAGDSYANCDGSSGTPQLTSNDFQCFLNRFAGGCP